MTKMIRFRPVRCKCGAEACIDFLGKVACRGDCLSCDRSHFIMAERGKDGFTDPDWWKPLLKEMRKRFKEQK